MTETRKHQRTCIAAIKNKSGKIVMAGDRRASWDWSLAQSMPRAKVSKRDGLLLGATGDCAICTLVVDIMDIPSVFSDLDTYMHFHLKPQIVKTLKNQGYIDEHKNLRIPSGMGCTVLIGVQGKLYYIDIVSSDDESAPYYAPSLVLVDEVNTPFAVGCGAPSAYPILLAKQKERGYNVKDDLTLALQIAAIISPGCDDKIDIIGE